MQKQHRGARVRRRRGDPTMSLRKFAAANHVNRPRILANSIRELAYPSRTGRELLANLVANSRELLANFSRTLANSRELSRTLANSSRTRELAANLRTGRELSRTRCELVANSSRTLANLSRIRSRTSRESSANPRESSANPRVSPAYSRMDTVMSLMSAARGCAKVAPAAMPQPTEAREGCSGLVGEACKT